jgi:iron complex transport system substrate-binding protein
LKLRAPTLTLASAAVLALLLVFSAEAGEARKGPAAGHPGQELRTVADETGRLVRIPVPVRRVVSLAPNLTESIYALGLEALLVGDTDYCDYPEAAKNKAKVGGAVNPNIEVVASLKPDLVLLTKSLNRLETVQALERLGIPAYATDPHSIDEIRGSVRKLAEVLGSPEAGDSLDRSLLKAENELRRRIEGVAPKRALFVIWTDPLISVGKHTFLADALSHAGALSVVDSAQDWPQISMEEMVRLQPEVLVFASSHSEAVAHDVEALALRPGWSSLEAVKKRRFAVVSDAVNRPAPRLLSAVEDLARQLHPEAFSEKPGAGTAAKEKE